MHSNTNVPDVMLAIEDEQNITATFKKVEFVDEWKNTIAKKWFINFVVRQKKHDEVEFLIENESVIFKIKVNDIDVDLFVSVDCEGKYSDAFIQSNETLTSMMILDEVININERIELKRVAYKTCSLLNGPHSIEVVGNTGTEMGIGRMTKQAYEYWNKEPDGISFTEYVEATNDDGEDKWKRIEHIIPAYAHIFNEYNWEGQCDIFYAVGGDFCLGSTVVVKDPEGKVIWQSNNNLRDLEKVAINFDDDYFYDQRYENNIQKDGIYYYFEVIYEHSCADEIFIGTFYTESEFGPADLEFECSYYKGDGILENISYLDQPIDNQFEGYDRWDGPYCAIYKVD